MSELVAEKQIQDLIKPGCLCVLYLSDGTTVRVRVRSDGKRPIAEDVADTIYGHLELKQAIRVDSSDIDSGTEFDIYVMPAHVVEFKIEKAGDLLGAVA